MLRSPTLVMNGREGFHGTRRFVVEDRLGAGGMGVVYRVRDLERNEVVALKTMARLDPETLLRFKKEFRALADISHPNVVQLYELFSEDDQWFFTMELVDGVDLLTWVKQTLSIVPDTIDDLPPTLAAVHPSVAPSASPSQRPAPAPRIRVRDLPRLRDALRQLAAGLAAIHAAGKLHRDVKPPNVMVTTEGKVVLLDFGVAADFIARAGVTSGPNESDPLAGTPAYMAPEQAAFEPARPASDWYAVGVILYEALTGRLPFEGSASSLLFQKTQSVPLPPSAYAFGVPADLEQLAIDLLARDPRARPTGRDVLARLEAEPHSFEDSARTSLFFGRTTELAALRDTFEASRTGLSVAMLRGRSGMGKSALAERFLGEASITPETLVFSGRCYEREAVPFKAVDSVIDEVREWLGRLPPGEAQTLLPREIDALAQVFTVLSDLLEGGPIHIDHIEPHELRRRAFSGLRELLDNIAKTRRLIVHIDDLQWCDADSVQLLEALFAAPAVPWMLLGAFRSELAASSPALADLRRAVTRTKAEREIEVSELDPAEATELAKQMIDPRASALAALVTEEARGNPLFLAELARWANDSLVHDPGDKPLSLENVVLDRVGRLPESARALFEVLCIAGGPLPHAVAASAAALEHGFRDPALVLRSERLVVTQSLADDDPIETAHDRVREIVSGALDLGRKRTLHARVGEALVTAGGDPQLIFSQFRAAEDATAAREWVLPAAREADRSLAFLRAAALYAEAIDLKAAPLATLYRRRADALASAGRLSEAADACLAGAAHADDADGLDLLRIAADNYLKSGRQARGLEVLQHVLSTADLPYPKTLERAIASLVWHEAKLRVGRLALRKNKTAPDARALARIDVAFTAASGLSLSDLVRSADFAARGLQLALEAGEPIRLSRALATAAGNAATRGESGRARAEELVRAAERIAAEVDEPRTVGFALLAAGLVDFFFGSWKSAQNKLERASALFRERCRAVAWELTNAQSWICNVLILSGDLREVGRRIPAILDEARAREDRFSLMNLVYPACISRIVVDDVPGAFAVARNFDIGAQGVVTSGWWGAFVSGLSVHRYRGDGTAAWEMCLAESKKLESSALYRSSMVRAFSDYERGLSALSSAAANHDRRAALAATERWAKSLATDRLRYAPALSRLLRAGLAAVRGDSGNAVAMLEIAIPELERADLGYLAACARHRRGELIGGALGRELVGRSRVFFDAQGIVNAERCVAMSNPGFK